MERVEHPRFMILSLCMQLILTLAAPFRKKTSNGLAIFVVWSAYLLADWAAIFAFGLISNAGCRNSNNHTEVAQDVMAFWAAFLLVHLGGPDTITAFSLEDNALWLRHLVGLIAQIFVFLYIFVKTFPHNGLLAPTILIFVAGVIKYEERTRSLYLASLENLKVSIKKTSKSGDDVDGDDEAHCPDELKPTFHFHKIFKGLIVDIVPNLSERNESRQFILQKGADEAFRLISTELNFLYEVFYTKIMAANSGWGVFIRSIAYFSTLVAFILFCLADKDEFRGVDVAITYALITGVFVLDIASGAMISMSVWTRTNGSMYLGLQFFRQGFLPFIASMLVYQAVTFLVRGSAIGRLIGRPWSEKMGTFNLLSHCFKQRSSKKSRKPGKVHLWLLDARISRVCVSPIDCRTTAEFVWEKLAVMRSTSKKLVNPDLWGLVFKDLERKAKHAIDAETMRHVYEARGDQAIQESLCPELTPYINDFQYDNTLLIWHIATEICYNIEGGVGCAGEMKMYSKILSDYMMYLLVQQPKLMSAVVGIGHIRLKETCIEAKLLGRELGAPTMIEFCTLILEEHANIAEPALDAHSVLNDSCKLVRSLEGNNNRWEIIFKVWMELLSYAAGHCKADSHTRLLSEGGEFITFVWMLMAHYGLGAQFPVK